MNFIGLTLAFATYVFLALLLCSAFPLLIWVVVPASLALLASWILSLETRIEKAEKAIADLQEQSKQNTSAYTPAPPVTPVIPPLSTASTTTSAE